MVTQGKSVAGYQRAAIRITGRTEYLSIKRFHHIVDGRLAIVKNFIQFTGLLAAALIDAVIFPGITPREVIHFEFLVVSIRKPAGLLIIEMIRRKLEIMIPERDLAGLKFVVAQKRADRSHKCVRFANIYKKRDRAFSGTVAMRLRSIRDHHFMDPAFMFEKVKDAFFFH